MPGSQTCLLMGYLCFLGKLPGHFLPQFTNMKNRDDNNTSASSSVIRIKLVIKCLVLIIISTH